MRFPTLSAFSLQRFASDPFPGLEGVLPRSGTLEVWDEWPEDGDEPRLASWPELNGLSSNAGVRVIPSVSADGNELKTRLDVWLKQPVSPLPPSPWPETLVAVLGRFPLSTWDAVLDKRAQAPWTGKDFKAFWTAPRVGLQHFGVLHDVRMTVSDAPIWPGARVVPAVWVNPSCAQVVSLADGATVVLEGGEWVASNGRRYSLAEIVRRWHRRSEAFSLHRRRFVPWPRTLLHALTGAERTELDAAECVPSCARVSGATLRHFWRNPRVGLAHGRVEGATVLEPTLGGNAATVRGFSHPDELNSEEQYEIVAGRWTGVAGHPDVSLADLVAAWRRPCRWPERSELHA